MKKTVVAGILSSVMAVSLLVGGGTYAFFSSQASSSDNSFNSAKVELSTSREDMPTEGPMFYPTNTEGWNGTGTWVPGMQVSRGMFVKNTGSANVYLDNLKTLPLGTAAEQADALKFAKEAMVIITALEPVNGNKSFDSTTYDLMLKHIEVRINEHFHDLFEENYLKAVKEAGGDLNFIQMMALHKTIYDSITKDLLGKVFTVKVLGESIEGRVSEIYKDTLYNLYQNGTNVAGLNFTLPTDESMYLGYTVKYIDLQDLNNQSLQGKNFKFTFSNEFRTKK